MYTLYFSPFSCSFVVHAALIKSGAEFALHEINLQKQEQLTDAFRAINPLAQVPALKTPGQTLTQVGAILLYLDERHPEAKLLPARGTPERYEALRWLFYFASSVHPLFNMSFYPERVTSGSTKEVVNKLGQRIAHTLQAIDAQLEHADFVAGSQASVADYYLAAVLNWAQFRSFDIKSFTSLSRCRQKIAALPEIRAASTLEMTRFKTAS